MKLPIKAIIQSVMASATAFFNWDSKRQSNSEQAHEQRCMTYADRMTDELTEIMPMLLLLNTNKATKDKILDIRTYIRKYRRHREKC